MTGESDSIVVRSARADDADSIGRIHVVSWQSAYLDALPEDFLQGLSIADRQQAWRQRLTAVSGPVRTLVVTDGGAVAGFACVSASRDEDAPEGTGELLSIYLDPASWSQGLGRRLHAEAVETLRRDGYQRATLWVVDSNARARRFYEHAGWTADGASKAHPLAGGPPLTVVRYVLPL
ncbi:GNAT family N-acetyltransferase [Amycolatopsis taiwanensis]|uniref:N-acetyltransferase n=1 Tax=Amycolatopsis taiwanensis TaxID=342230 RepID=A0A9W6R202_9PSEU|nr:GNAT family N-acetyltransferase [Amycolatopsis taiwanensis]GLY67276.1 N-acetyltransferase [Amycolatopsis taiwanensis]